MKTLYPKYIRYYMYKASRLDHCVYNTSWDSPVSTRGSRFGPVIVLNWGVLYPYYRSMFVRLEVMVVYVEFFTWFLSF